MKPPDEVVPPAMHGPPRRDAIAALREAVRGALAARPAPCYLLAVSGGIDSMVLFDAAAAVLDRSAFLVATFDHGTGLAATAAARAVETAAAALGVPIVTGVAPARTAPRRAGGDEAQWRRARWRFLREVAATHGAAVVTAHNQDDQIETVVMRVLREAGPRGLSALYAESDILRPLLSHTRSTIAEYAAARQIIFVTDPSNFDRRHLRNRIRHDLLPALRGVDPGFGEAMLEMARRAAEWRAQIDAVAATFTALMDATGTLHVPRAQFASFDAESLRALWPAIVARAGVVMDWRGTHRLAEFTIEGTTGQAIQLSGGIEVRMRREALVVRRWRDAE